MRGVDTHEDISHSRSETSGTLPFITQLSPEYLAPSYNDFLLIDSIGMVSFNKHNQSFEHLGFCYLSRSIAVFQ